MKRILLFLVWSFIILKGYSQTNQWTWIKGDTLINQYGVYGTKGIAASNNRPGSRQYAATWTDPQGNFWLFGGSGYAASAYGLLNDLWKYTPSTGLWAWITGDNFPNQIGGYGTKGITGSSNNSPGARNTAVTWTDTSGNLWLFGGGGYALDNNISGYLNDLWKYNTATNYWTWMSGDNIPNQAGIYGTQGAPAAANKPGAKSNATGWADKSGNMWLYGGNGYGTGFGGDLWKYEPSTGQWAWISGDNIGNQKAVYGVKGISAATNKPGGKSAAISWSDTSGNFWLFGGVGNSFYNSGGQNDLWRFTPSTGMWAWMSGDSTINQSGVYGSTGVAEATNKPGARQYAPTFSDLSGNLWMFGGSGYASSGSGYLNDLWKYSTSTGMWTWMKGDSIASQLGVYGAVNITDPINTPPGKQAAAGWADLSGNFWIFGGNNITGSFYGNMNDLWKYTPSTGQWTWTGGDNINSQVGFYGTKGISSPANNPGGRYNAMRWNDPSGNLWLFGGYGNASVDLENLNDLWKFSVSTGEWTWISGDNIVSQPGIYGARGEAAPANKPGARFSAVTWTDASGNLWLFGGNGNTGSGNQGFYNDLWKFDPSSGLWTWVSGDNTTNQVTIYGTKGIPSSSNKPGSRQAATSWADNSGNLWMFGGTGYTTTRTDYGTLNELWKYNILSGQWTWMGGDAMSEQKGIYKTKGIPDLSNKPGARNFASSWTDATGNLWMYGGFGWNNFTLAELGDLWKYSPSTGLWNWVGGTMNSQQLGIYGTTKISSASNLPGGREQAVAGKDAYGNFWLFGGTGYAASASGALNDFWKFSPSTGEWTWMSGDSIPNQAGKYGVQGLASPANTPGARQYASGWTDAFGKFWLFGGYGYASNGKRYLNDLWQYTIPSTTLPVQLTGFTVQKEMRSVHLRWTTASELNTAYFIAERSGDGLLFDSISNIASSGNTTLPTNYSLIDNNPLAGVNFYRLRQVDKDGMFHYSSIARIVMDDGMRFNIIQNPVLNNLQLNLQLAAATKLTLQVRDINGHLLLIKEYQGTKGNSIYSFPVSQLASGTYFIHLQTGSGNSTKPFVKL